MTDQSDSQRVPETALGGDPRHAAPRGLRGRSRPVGSTAQPHYN